MTHGIAGLHLSPEYFGTAAGQVIVILASHYHVFRKLQDGLTALEKRVDKLEAVLLKKPE